jgi:hypothetical protein
MAQRSLPYNGFFCLLDGLCKLAIKTGKPVLLPPVP